MAEPISYSEAKLHLRLDNDDEQALVESYIAAAREWVENYTGIVLVAREFEEHRDCFGSYIEIWRRPISAIDGISYTDADGASQTYADPVTRLNRIPARVYPAAGGSWPSVGANGSVTITYTAGHADPADAPLGLKQAILLLVEHWYSNRGLASASASAAELPFAVTALCDQHRQPVI